MNAVIGQSGRPSAAPTSADRACQYPRSVISPRSIASHNGSGFGPSGPRRAAIDRTAGSRSPSSASRSRPEPNAVPPRSSSNPRPVTAASSLNGPAPSRPTRRPRPCTSARTPRTSTPRAGRPPPSTPARTRAPPRRPGRTALAPRGHRVAEEPQDVRADGGVADRALPRPHLPEVDGRAELVALHRQVDHLVRVAVGAQRVLAVRHPFHLLRVELAQEDHPQVRAAEVLARPVRDPPLGDPRDDVLPVDVV